jgi:alkylation response protein AidB-like acyl-CoA dehydrogenase
MQNQATVLKIDQSPTDWMAAIHDLGPRFAERAERHDDSDEFVAENFADLKAARLFSAAVPTDLGGGGASHSEMCRIVRTIAHYCPSTALSFSMHQHLVAAQIWNYRRGKPGRKLLERVAADELVLISTGAKDWLGSNGFVEKVDGGYRVSAKKFFASGSPAGDLLITSAPYEDPEEGWQVLHFPVPFTAEGVRIDKNWKAMGMRGTGSNTVVLEEVFVPEEAIALKRPQDRFHPVWNVVLTVAMPLISSAYAGLAEEATRIVKKGIEKRASDPVLPYLLGELENSLTSVQLAVDSMVVLANDLDFEPELERTNAILVRKTLACKAVASIVSRASSASCATLTLGSFIRCRRSVSTCSPAASRWAWTRSREVTHEAGGDGGLQGRPAPLRVGCHHRDSAGG